MWYEAAAVSDREMYVTRPQPKVDVANISAVGRDGYIIEAKYRVEGGMGPRGALSCDTRLASLLVLSEEGAPEHLEPSFSPGISTYRNAVALPSSASTVSVIARARDPAAMVSIYRYDPTADMTIQRAVDQLARAVLIAPHRQTDEQRAAAKLQAAIRGAAIRRQLAARGDLSGHRTGRRTAGATAGELCSNGVTATAVFTGTARQRAQRAAAVAAEAGLSTDRALAAFAQADKDKSGCLSKRELRSALGLMGVQLTRPELSAQLAAYDVDADGVLSGDEFVRLAFSLLASHVHIRNVFDAYDRDGSGGLSKRELRSGLRALGIQLTGDEARRCLAHHDADASGALSIAEFAGLVRSLAVAAEAEEGEDGGGAAGKGGAHQLWQRTEEALIEREQAAGDTSSRGVAIAPDVPELCLADMAARAVKRWMRANLMTLTSFFLQVDRDGSGTIDRTELRRALQALRFECTKDEVRRVCIVPHSLLLLDPPPSLAYSNPRPRRPPVVVPLPIRPPPILRPCCRALPRRPSPVPVPLLHLPPPPPALKVDALFLEMGVPDGGTVDLRSLKCYLLQHARSTNETRATLSLWGAAQADAAELAAAAAEEARAGDGGGSAAGAGKAKGSKAAGKDKSGGTGGGKGGAKGGAKAVAKAGGKGKPPPKGAKGSTGAGGGLGRDAELVMVTTIKIVVIAEDRSTCTYVVHVTREPESHGGDELPGAPVALSGLLGHLIGYYGQQMDEQSLPEPMARARAAGRRLADQAAPRMAERAARHGGRAGQPAEGGRGSHAISEDRFVDCCTTLRIATAPVARLAFRQVATRPYVVLDGPRFWHALCFTFVRALSDEPLARRRSADWQVNPALLLESICDTLLPLAYNITAAVATADAQADLCQQRREAFAASETEARTRALYRATSAGRLRPGTPGAGAAVGQGRPGAGGAVGPGTSDNSRDGEIPRVAMLTLEEEEEEYLRLLDGDKPSPSRRETNRGVETAAGADAVHDRELHPAALRGGAAGFGWQVASPGARDARAEPWDDSVLGPGRDTSHTRLDQARAEHSAAAAAPTRAGYVRPFSASTYIPSGAGFIGSVRIGATATVPRARPMTAPTQRSVISPFPTPSHLVSLHAAPPPPQGSRSGSSHRAARAQLGGEAEWARAAFPGDPIIEKPARSAARTPLAPPPSSLTGEYTREYMRRMRRVWQEQQQPAISVAERSLRARLASIDAMTLRDGSSPALMAHRRLCETVALYALPPAPQRVAWEGPARAVAAKKGAKKGAAGSGKKKKAAKKL